MTDRSDIAAVLDGVDKRFPKAASFSRLLKSWRREQLRVLDGASLAVHRGEIVALTGANGAGKSTIMRLFCGLLVPDAGVVRVFGLNPADEAVRRRLDIGVVLPNDRSFFWRLTLRRNLEFFGALQDLPPHEAALSAESCAKRVGVDAALDRPFRELSDGMKQRAAVARALLNRPRLLLVDEATRSLDAGGAERVRTLITELARYNGVAVLLASHNLDEVAALADRVLYLEDGRVRIDGLPAAVGSEILARLQAREAEATR
ncbi:MAG: ABC transporter ATP-binding protein [Myxococcales bacterium]|nr:MAG: ABC transporter ATP-binding protein [Myxococcales bacterium]